MVRASYGSTAVGLLLGLSVVALARVPRAEASKPAAHAVVSESPDASRDGRAILDQGGTAIDAAVAAAFVAGLTSPTSSGIGGGGFALFWDAAAGRPTIIDFRETAPQGLVAEPFERRPLERAEVGHLVGVPGEVRGLYALHQKGGKLPWATLVKKAEDRARRGYTVGAHLGAMVAYGSSKLSQAPGFSSLFYAGGRPALVGSRIVNLPLAETLRKIAQEGPRAFYEGEVAEDVVATARAHKSPITLDDLRNYQVKERTPLKVRYGGRDVYTMPPPSAGGLMVAEVLTLLAPDDLQHLGHGSAAYEHLVAEAMRAAIADRARYVSDPDMEPVDIERLLDPKRMERRRAMISLDRTHALPRFGLEEHGTHHLITSDRAGNVVALTTTVNRLFGSKIMAEKSGVVLNDELDDFSLQTSVTPFGLSESPNRPRPGARPVSSMTPTLVVEDNQVVLALGGSGGTAIATNVTQVLLSALVFDHQAKKAVSQDRIYIPTSGKTVLVEKGTSAAHVEELSWRGELVGEMPFSTTAVQMLRFDGGQVDGAADPRKHGSAEVR